MRLPRSQFFWQLLVVGILVWLGYVLASNIEANLAKSNIVLSFDFLSGQAGFDISESLLPVSSTSSYGSVILAGVLNTLTLAFCCIIGATVIGVLMGILRTSGHYLGERVAGFYIEITRNLPKLLILLALYLAMVTALPVVRESWSFFGLVQISNRAVYFPVIEQGIGLYWVIAMLVIWPAALLILGRVAHRIQERTGIRYPVVWPVSIFILAMIAVPATTGLIEYPLSWPVLRGFDFAGGGRISVQFLVLVLALSIYHGGQVAELVRGAIQSVPIGQFEAARASGLSFAQMTRLVILPQAVRAAVPSMGNQYLNITKNTSIALAVGYSDLVSVMTTSINQTFRPIELMTVSMGVYLGICLIVSWLVNIYNARVQMVRA
ncbi:amino acid ABC transporter permease [Thalassospira lucentensis]|uniref:amino acid ABC transporter permease n=1 Tax=Thalassospira lucentensis TaxID=168935 RepID=UPI002943C5FE|nr:ABC transporter permease subunit [Thalassospira lucentensis]WOI11796.1 ABC transporter permease subunit [Thalassospira lucentensis]